MLAFSNQSTLEYPHHVGLVNGQLLLITQIPFIMAMLTFFHRLEAELNQTWYQAAFGLGLRGSGLTSATTPIADQSGVRTLQTSINGTGLVDTTYGSMLATVPTRVSTQYMSVIATDGIGALVQASQPYVHLKCWPFYASVDGDAQNEHIDFGPERPYLRNLISIAELMPNFTETKINKNTTIILTPDPNYDAEDELLGRLLWRRLPPEVANHSLIFAQVFTEPPYRDWFGASCTIDALWVQASTNYTTAYVATNDDAHKVLSSPKDERLIVIDPDWIGRAYRIVIDRIQKPRIDTVFYQVPFVALALAAIPSPYDDIKTSGDFFSRALGIQQDSSSLTRQQCEAMRDYVEEHDTFSTYDAIEVFSGGADWTDPASLAQIQARRYRHGYGYDSEPVTVRLSLVVLSIYAAATAIFFSYTLITGTTATSWDSISDLIALALNSQRPDTFKDTSVGISTLEIFRTPLGLRANQRGSVEMMFSAGKKEQPDPYSDVEANKKY